MPPRCLPRVLRNVQYFLGDLDISSILYMTHLVKKMLFSAAPSTNSCSTDHQNIKPDALYSTGAGSCCLPVAPRPIQNYCPGKNETTH